MRKSAILDRIRTLRLRRRDPGAGAAAARTIGRDFAGRMPMVLLGRSSMTDSFDTVTIDNLSAGSQATNYLLDLGHRRIGSITGPTAALDRKRPTSRACSRRWRRAGSHLGRAHVRSGEFREDTAYSVARDLLGQPDRPTALYVANGVMALGVMRAIADLGLRCPEDISIASTDNIAGIGGLRPHLTRTEHPVSDMTNEALRMLVDRIEGKVSVPARNIVFQPALVVGESCMRIVALSSCGAIPLFHPLPNRSRQSSSGSFTPWVRHRKLIP